MPQLTEAGQVVTHPDGSRTFTHGSRHPDNQQVVIQDYDAQGRLTRAQVKWSGFAGRVLDVTATFGADGKLLKEEGYRAPEMTTPVTDLLKPLPAGTPTQAPVTPTPDTAPVVVPSLAPAPVAPTATPKADAPESGTPEKAAAVAKADEAEDESAEDEIVKGLHTIYGAQPKAGAENN